MVTMKTDLNHPSWSPVNLVPVEAMVMVVGLVVLFGSDDSSATAAAALSSKHPSPDAVVSMAATVLIAASCYHRYKTPTKCRHTYTTWDWDYPR
ncbi:hypothetical protein F4860DRAFT_458125 [Xylaria cubensis]|nr:hypothetical protein F4860DRAFT_458125 [Xylaria cubensis]